MKCEVMGWTCCLVPASGVTGVVDPEGIRIDFESECAQGLSEGTCWKDAYREQRSKL